MLYKLHIDIFIIGLIAFGLMATAAIGRVGNIMTLAPLLAFITQVSLLLNFSRNDKNDNTDKTLFFTVLIYDVLIGILFMLICEYYDGDTFMFSKSDAMLYYSESMRIRNMGLADGLESIMQRHEFDDWGAMFFDSILMYIIPSKYFLNAFYFVFSAISSVYLFRIGKSFMPDNYAFLAALGYGTSSFVVFFNCTFLKEALFVFIVICAMYHTYNAICHNSRKSMVFMFLCIILILFFRPAVAAFIVLSVFTYYGIALRGRAISLFMYLISAIVFVASITKMQEATDAYTAGGDIDAVIAYRSNGGYSSSFNYFVSYFGAFLGPFPTLFPKIDGPARISYYGAGLMYKLFLVIPFWAGVFYAIKERVIMMIPLIVFILVEMFATAAICASLELRKVLLHIPFTYLLSFYGMYHLFMPTHPTRLTTVLSYSFVIGILFFWNVIRA